jgi:hypothetical protein
MAKKELSEFEKLVAEFESSLQPVEVAPEIPAAPVVQEETASPTSTVVPAGEPCLTQAFKKLVYALPADYIGEGGGDVKDMIVQLVESMPQCAA